MSDPFWVAPAPLPEEELLEMGWHPDDIEELLSPREAIDEREGNDE